MLIYFFFLPQCSLFCPLSRTNSVLLWSPSWSIKPNISSMNWSRAVEGATCLILVLHTGHSLFFFLQLMMQSWQKVCPQLVEVAMM
jgi:hypothetical protein